jgi:pimeloyl-ACP methyl ester carboxylesterase
LPTQTDPCTKAHQTVKRWLQGASPDDALVERLTDMIAATQPEGFVQAARALQSYDLSRVVPAIACPLLLIAGAKDGVMPETMRSAFGSVPGVQLHLIPEAGHVPNFEAPEAFNEILLPFLRPQPATADPILRTYAGNQRGSLD